MTSADTTATSNTHVAPTSNPQRPHSLTNFLASDTPITIVPSFHYKTPLTFLLTQTSVGPFYAGVNTTVPLWLGLYLRKRNLCRLVPPEWMSVPHLKSVLAFERDPNQDTFSEDLPFRYVEIARGILQTCGAGRSAVHAAGGDAEELPQSEQVRVLLEDISTVRMDKIRRHVHKLSAESMALSGGSGAGRRLMPVVNVTGIGAVEMVAVKPFLEGSFGDHLKLVKSGSSVATGRTSAGVGAENQDPNSAPVITSVRSRIRRYR